MFPVERIKIIGHSMEPTIESENFALLNRWIYKFRRPKTGEVVVFKSPDGKMLCKRITKIDLATNTYELLGDNPEDSRDSRMFGSIKLKDILGKVMFQR